MVWNKIKKFGLFLLSGAVIASGYGALYYRTGEINPIRQIKYPAAYRQIFGEKGYADKDKDGKISMIEKIEAYKIMGIESKINTETINTQDDEGFLKYKIDGEFTVFYKPTLKELEKGIKAYKAP